jgi:hypothetical protein
MKYHARILLALCVWALAGPLPAQDTTPAQPTSYVPYKDLAAIFSPDQQSVLMERGAFEKLLDQAQANARQAGSIELGQITGCDYQAAVAGSKLTLAGQLSLVSMSDKPVSIPLGYAQIGLTQLTLDDKPAPLGYDGQGRLVLIVAGRGTHRLAVAGSGVLSELPGGGMQFGLTIPAAVAGSLKLVVPGDIGIHATAPVSSVNFDKAADRTEAVLTIGGQDHLTVVLMGNGRREDDKPLLLGESSTLFTISPTQQTLSSLYTVQVLRRGVGDLEFELEPEWTITDVACPNLVKWSIQPGGPGVPQRLTVHLRSASQGPQALTIQAIAPRSGQTTWASPHLKLAGAAFQRGYIMIDTGEQLRVRGEKTLDARREDASVAATVARLLAGPGRLMYYHWGEQWSVQLDLAPLELRIASVERQLLGITPEQLSLSGQFQITAVGRELYDLSFELPPAGELWDISSVRAPGKFEYRVVESKGKRTLQIELASPILAEGLADIAIDLHHVPAEWNWAVASSPRQVRLPLIKSSAQTVSGLVAVSSSGDLESAAGQTPAGLKAVSAGRMAALGFGREYQAAWSYESPAEGWLSFGVSRAQPRLSAQAVGLVSVQPSQIRGDWTVTYDITRASTRTLYLLADKSIGQEIKIEPVGRRLVSRTIVSGLPEGVAGILPAPLAGETPATRPQAAPIPAAEGYDTWMLTLDGQAQGQVVLQVHYDRPLPKGTFAVPLVRPAAIAQGSELLAIQASEELALEIKPSGTSDVDAIDLPPLPAPSRRILAAYRLDNIATPSGLGASVQVATTMHDSYDIATAIAVSANLTTFLGPGGVRDTEATFNVVNGGLQFLNIRLPAGAQLWSVAVDQQQAKPKRGSADEYLVSLPRSRTPQAVKVVYRHVQPAAADGQIVLAAPTLPDVKVNSVSWSVTPPPGYRISSADGKMQITHAPLPRPMWRQVLDAGVEISLGPTLGGRSYGPTFAKYQYSPPMPASVSADKLSSAKSGAAAQDGFSHATTSPTGGATPTEEQRPQAPPPVQAAQPSNQAMGRYTLPVSLVGNGSDEALSFSSLGLQSPRIALTPQSRDKAWRSVSFLAVALLGLLMLGATALRKLVLIVGAVAVSMLLSTWWPATTALADGIFLAALLLAGFYIAVRIIRWIGRRIRRLPLTLKTSARVAIAVACVLASVTGSGAQSVSPPTAQLPAAAPASVMPPPLPSQSIVVPYTGDPTKADQAGQVLLPYSRFVELWNLADPTNPMQLPLAMASVSLAGVTYEATLAGEQMKITLTADLKTYGKGWVMQPMPMSGLAVVEASINGQPAQLQVGPKGMVLALQAPVEGKLVVTAVATPKILGRRGSLDLSLPPLPAAVMKVTLPEGDLDLDVPQIEGTIASRQVGNAVEFTVPLGTLSQVSLRWSPKTGGAGDKTLSAQAVHDVHVFHWGLVGNSKISFAFSAGENDRFLLAVPAALTLTDITAPNLRDYRVVGQQTLEGEQVNLVEVRLHRATSKAFDLSATWIAPLPALDKPFKLPLPQAGQVGRESGAVAISVAGGMSAKVTEVSGGRREAQPPAAPPEAIWADATTPVARYYWPYRPFSLSLQLARQAVGPKARLDQLVRINADDVQLLVQAELSSDNGRIFSASFSLPDEYEVLSALGGAVNDWYVQTTPPGRRLHVNFRSGLTRTKIALVMVRKDSKLDSLAVPSVGAIDSDGKPLSQQSGRLAVQVAAALAAQTVSSANLTAIRPQQTADWLDARQVQAVQFAYSYERPEIGLQLAVARKPTQVRAEVFAGLTVEPTSAWYTYRLRYTIDGSPIDRVSFTLPRQYAPLVAVSSGQLRNVAEADEAGDLKRWTVVLANELTGVLDVTVNLALPIDAATTHLAVPHIATDAPAGYQLALAVQNLSRHELAVEKSSGLTAMPPSEQQKLLEEPVRKSLQYVFASTQQDWSLDLKLTLAKQAARIQAVVDLMTIATVVDKAGQCRYEVTLSLQNRSEQFLRIQLPKQLSLWSASVAGEPVKPVTRSSAGQEVLIPLVKTSPGGLPYDVRLYLAGKLDNTPDGVTRLQLPTVKILGIDVVRTAWSLRLPEGYRYIRPGGNMSEAGQAKAGAAQLMSLEIDARLDQLKRLASVTDLSSVKGRALAGKNWDEYNRKVEGDIAQAQQYLARNKDDIDQTRLERLNSRLSGQRASQEELKEQYRQGQQDVSGNNINDFLNGSAQNTGTSSAAGDQSLATLPAFVKQASQDQQENLANEFKANQQAESLDQGARRLSEAKGKLQVNQPTRADQLLNKDDSDKEVSGVLKNLEGEKSRQVAKRQEELSKQLKEIQDNRLGRFYSGQGAAQSGPPAAPAGPVVSGSGTGPISGAFLTPNAARPDSGAVRGFYSRLPGGAPSTQPAQAEANGAFEGGWRDEMPDHERAGFDTAMAYATGQTYSLPVELPSGQVELSFQRPGGDAELSVLAVKSSVYQSAYGTLDVLVVLALTLVAWRLGPRIGRFVRQMRPLRIVLFAVLLLMLLWLGGLIGLALWLVILVIVEAIIRAFGSRRRLA